MVTAVSSQWLFPVSALHKTPSRMTSDILLDRELYDRSRGVEFLYRLGVSLALPSSAMYTAATWFHRFYMRYSMEDYHRQDVAAACVFLATKTEECGRKLRDVAKVVCSKISKIDINSIPDDSKEVEECQTSILLTEEVLLEALCFDFVVESPHAELVDLYDARSKNNNQQIEECAWTIANDSFRTPLCVLYSPKVIAAACYVLAEQAIEGPQSSTLDARIASPAPSATLPTPPSHNAQPNSISRHAVEFFGFNETELANVADAITILLEYYGAQELQGSQEFLTSVASIPPPASASLREKLYKPFSNFAPVLNQPVNNSTPEHTISQGTTPTQPGGGTPGKFVSGAWKPVTEGIPEGQ